MLTIRNLKTITKVQNMFFFVPPLRHNERKSGESDARCVHSTNAC